MNRPRRETFEMLLHGGGKHFLTEAYMNALEEYIDYLEKLDSMDFDVYVKPVGKDIKFKLVRENER